MTALSSHRRTAGPRAVGTAARCALALAVAASAGGLAPRPASAHDFRAGALVIDHPYAVPSPAGATSGAAYLRTLRNTGAQPDRLLSASTPAAAAVELQHATMDGDVMRMHAVEAIELKPGAALPMRHGGEWQLTLMRLTAPLKAGDQFPLTLRFERAGERTVPVTVQLPRDAAGAVHTH